MTADVGGVALRALAQRFGTPLYAFDAARIRHQVAALERSLEGVPHRILYSVKAHANVALLRLLADLGVGADVCSAGDLAYAAAAGLRGDDISLATVSLDAETIAAAVDLDAFAVVDSLTQIERWAVSGGRRDIGVRVAAGITAGFHPLVQAGAPGAKFGVAIDDVPEAVRRASGAGLRVVGLHGHLGSDLMDAAPHLALLDLLLDLTERHVPDATMVDVGGGLGTPFPPQSAGDAYPPVADDPSYPCDELGRGAAERLAVYAERTGADLQLRIEPGAFLVMESGTLVCQVTDIKAADERSEGRPRQAVVDSSYNHLHSAVVHETFHPALVDAPSARPLAAHDVVGNLMQAGDVLAADRVLPHLEVGDVLGFGLAGGYKACRAPVFNGRPRPAEVLVDDGTARLTRRAETTGDLLSFDLPVCAEASTSAGERDSDG